MYLSEICDEILYWLLIILSFLNLNCLLSLFILIVFYVSFMGVSYFWNLFLMKKGWRISVSRLWADFTFFWWKLLAVPKSFGLMLIVEVWPYYFFLQASTEFTHSFGFEFLISFLRCNLVPSEVFIFLFRIFCILVSFWCGIHSAFWWWFWCTVGFWPIAFCFIQ